jgi:hypothetical protein
VETLAESDRKPQFTALFSQLKDEDMAEQVAFGVLRHDRANMRADAAVEQSRLLFGITLDRQAAQQQTAPR